MMSHPVRAKENEQNNVVHMDSFTNLSTQIGALSKQIKVHAVVPAMGLCKATIPKSVRSYSYARASTCLYALVAVHDSCSPSC
jgi:hypothetical protein